MKYARETQVIVIIIMIIVVVIMRIIKFGQMFKLIHIFQ